VVKRRAAVPLAVLLLASTGCKFSELVTAPPGESTVIAQMVLNTAAPVQTLLLERADVSTSSGHLSGATVRLTHSSPDASCARPTVTLTETNDSIIYGRTGDRRRVYQTGDLCALHPGDRVALRVETREGEVVTGTTQIPGASQILVKVGSTTAVAPRVLSLDRTRDSVHVEVTPQFGRALDIEVSRKGGHPYRFSNLRPQTRPVFDITTDAMHATIPGNLSDPFEDDDEDETIFRAGVVYLFSFAPTDTAYFDFVRSGANPFTGRGFINHLSGGIGVFGSVAPQIYEVRVTAPQRDPREGVYRLYGPLTLAGVSTSVDVTWDVYLDAPSGPGQFSALTDGTWIEGPVHASVDGTFAGGLHAQFYGVPLDPLAATRAFYEVDYNGPLPPRGTPFTATVRAVVGNRITTDRVTVVQVSGP
jgi:hypothetical protein